MASATESKEFLWFVGIWAAFVAVAMTYYLIRSWKRGMVTLPPRGPDVSRDESPGKFWFSMLIYLAVDVFAITGLSVRLYKCIFSSR